MRKEYFICVLALLISALLFSACNGSLATDSGSEPGFDRSTLVEDAPSTEATSSSQTAETDSSASSFEKSFGTYSIAEDWFESEELSSSDTFFYLKEGVSFDTPTSSISVFMGENKYSINEYQLFARAIDRQLKTQIGSDATEYYGGGSYTDKGYPLIKITFVIDNIRTTQYYIAGDYRFVMVHATDFGDEQIPDVEEASLAIVNSFVWAESTASSPDA